MPQHLGPDSDFTTRYCSLYNAENFVSANRTAHSLYHTLCHKLSLLSSHRNRDPGSTGRAVGAPPAPQLSTYMYLCFDQPASCLYAPNNINASKCIPSPPHEVGKGSSVGSVLVRTSFCPRGYEVIARILSWVLRISFVIVASTSKVGTHPPCQPASSTPTAAPITIAATPS